MGILENFKNLARPYDEDDNFYDNDDEFPEEGFNEEPPVREQAPPRPQSTQQSATASQQGFGSAQTAASSAFGTASNSRSSFSNFGSNTPQMVIVKPDKFENAAEIADHLRERRAVVMNIEKVNAEVARRLIDFLSGVAYALDGKIQRIPGGTFVIAPSNVQITGEIVDELENNGLYL